MSPTDQSSHNLPPTAALAAMAGNLMEWYDFALYGVLAPTLGLLFFPGKDKLASTLAVFGVFAAGYVARLAGGAFFGYLADHSSRRKALIFSATTMACSTALAGCLPVYDSVGILAPIAFLTLRILQGVSTGGEFTTSVVFMVEKAPPDKRGLIGSLSGTTAGLGILLGSAIGSALFSFYPIETVHAWAWRIPFLLSIPLGLAVTFLRTAVPPEPQTPFHHSSHHRSSLLHVVKEHPIAVIGGALRGWGSVAGFYIVAVFLSSYLVTSGLMSPSGALGLQTMGVATAVLMAPVGGYLSDRFGRRTMVIVSASCVLVLAWPLFTALRSENHNLSLLLLIAFAACVGTGMAPYSTWLAEERPRFLRASWMGVTYNIAAGILGGSTPLVAGLLIEKFHSLMAPAALLVAASIVTIVISLFARETNRKVLN